MIFEVRTIHLRTGLKLTKIKQQNHTLVSEVPFWMGNIALNWQWLDGYLVSISPLTIANTIDNKIRIHKTNPGIKVSNPMPLRTQTKAVSPMTPKKTMTLELEDLLMISPDNARFSCWSLHPEPIYLNLHWKSADFYGKVSIILISWPW